MCNQARTGGSKRQNKQNKQNENKQQNKQNEEKEKAKWTKWKDKKQQNEQNENSHFVVDSLPTFHFAFYFPFCFFCFFCCLLIHWWISKVQNTINKKQNEK